jgi:hypothetical protein
LFIYIYIYEKAGLKNWEIKTHLPPHLHLPGPMMIEEAERGGAFGG